MNRELAKECLEALNEYNIFIMRNVPRWRFAAEFGRNEQLIARLRAAIEEPTDEELLDHLSHGVEKMIVAEPPESELPYVVHVVERDENGDLRGDYYQIWRKFDGDLTPVVRWDQSYIHSEHCLKPDTRAALLAAYRKSKKEPANE